ncbi:MAG TPA: sialidase family protein, partial [Bryobacteraceae bacterium]
MAATAKTDKLYAVIVRMVGFLALFSLLPHVCAQSAASVHPIRPGHQAPRGLLAVAGPSPFAPDCNGSQSGINFRNSVVEPFLAADPNNPAHLIGTWQQDRWSNGGASGVVAAVSMDGGRTWTRSSPRFSVCTGGSFQRASDPWVAISPGGTAYLSVLALNNSNSATAILVSRSSDGGLSWGEPVTIVRDAGGGDDKETIAADPNDPHYAYVVWTGSLSGIGSQLAMFSRTIDGGATWEPPKAIYGAGAGAAAFDNQIFVLPDGSIVDIFIL